jgi:bifunctional non-homologous end joining protein LigD
VIDYYVRVAPRLLPHLEGRPLTLKRYPNGVDESFFYEKRCPPHAPAWIQRAPGSIPYCVIDGLASLVWVANLASLELHPSLALAATPEVPTVVAFDLDPGAPADVVDCARLAGDLRDMLAVLGLECFPKTSGSKGMQVYVPLNTPTTFDATRAFSQAVALTLERQMPERVVATMAKQRRGGRVFVDWAQNHPTKTTVAAYSLRAMPEPTVSTPVTWDEVENARSAADLTFTAAEVLERENDPFAPVATLQQEIPSHAA